MPQVPRGGAVAVVTLVVVAVVGFSTLYQVQPEEVGVVLRFGRYVATTEPAFVDSLGSDDEVE